MLKNPHFQSFGIAAIMEIVLIGGLLSWVADSPATSPVPVLPLDMQMTQETKVSPQKAPAPVEQAKPLPLPTQPKATTSVKPETVFPPVLEKPAPAEQVEQPKEAVKMAEQDLVPPPGAMSPETSPKHIVETVVPTPVQRVVLDPSDEYKSRVAAAVQGAFSYPPAAAQMGYHGRVRVAFSLRDGHPSDSRILVSGGMQLVDRAALRTIVTASYPPTPTPLEGAAINFEVWIEFRP